MRYADIEAANKKIEAAATKIKGKDYVSVNARVLAFRMLHPDGSIVTAIEHLEDGLVVMKATASDGEGRCLATGWAYEREVGNINKTSFVENCETSAVGRALGFLGIGINGGIASAEEMDAAIAQQKAAEAAQAAQLEEYSRLRSDLLKAGVDVRSASVEGWILEKSNIQTQDIGLLSIQQADRLLRAYRTLLEGKMQEAE